jgi:hypothetical protein
MSDNSAVQPLCKVIVRIKCSNPKCHKTFSVELDEKSERLCQCENCGKRYYIHGSTPIWVKALNCHPTEKLKEELNNI